MQDQGTFAEFIRRIRAGDAEAATELVRQYEPVIRLEVRLRLVDPRLRRVLDTMDVCQSVLSSFFVRAASGQYDLERPDQLVKLLVVMTRNKVAHQARWQHAQRRDSRREVDVDANALLEPADDASPSRLVAARDLLSELRRRMTDEERRIGDLRAQGLEWTEIADRVGGTPQARRKQLARAVERIAGELGLDESTDG